MRVLLFLLLLRCSMVVKTRKIAAFSGQNQDPCIKSNVTKEGDLRKKLLQMFCHLYFQLPSGHDSSSLEMNDNSHTSKAVTQKCKQTNGIDKSVHGQIINNQRNKKYLATTNSDSYKKYFFCHRITL